MSTTFDAEIRCIRAFYGATESEKYPAMRFGDYYLSKHMKAQHMKAEPAAALQEQQQQ